LSLLIFDLDGVVWHANTLINNKIPSVIARLRKERHEIYFLTNNSTRSQYGYQKKLSRMGIRTELSNIICTANAARIYLQKKIGSLKTKPVFFVVGEAPLKKEIKKLGVEFAGIDDDKKVDYVVVGVDWHFNYKKLARAMTALLNGAKFIATNADTTLPIKNKKARPGCGAIVAAITAASNRRPYVIGKPNPLIVRNFFGKRISKRKDVFIIGDRLDTDIVLANRIKAHPVLVLSGATMPEAAKKATGSQKPEFILKDITEIGKIFKG